MAPTAKRRGKAKPAARGRPMSEVLDYRSSDDDAWYAVRLELEREDLLRVMYCNFDETHDVWYSAADFKSAADIEEFCDRLRVASSQLQDSECRSLVEGILICASYSTGPRDLRFYDAVIDSICNTDHKKTEECTCTFQVLWQQGPAAGDRTTVGIDNICLLKPQSSSIHPIVDRFVEVSRKMLDAKK